MKFALPRQCIRTDEVQSNPPSVHTSMLTEIVLIQHFQKVTATIMVTIHLSPTNSFSKGLFLNPDTSKAAFNSR